MHKPIAIVALLLLSACATSGSHEHRRATASSAAGEQLTFFFPILEEDSDPINIRTGVPGPGNERSRFVGIYNNPEYTPLIDLVDEASETIDIEIYMMTDPSFRAALRRALERGVAIRVVKDPTALGETCRYFDFSAIDLGINDRPVDDDCVDQRKLVQEVREKGGSFVPFNKTELCGKTPEATTRCFQHGKILVIDRNSPKNRLALISSGNFNSSSLCRLENSPSTCNRDYSYVTRDSEVIDALIAVLEDDAAGKRYQPTSQRLQRKLTVSPFSKEPLINFIRTARRSIQVQNQYMKDGDVNQALIDAADRGVRVEMMLASDCAFGRPRESAKASLETLYRSLESAGIRLRFFTAQMRQKERRGYLHSKAIVVDGETAWVGSVNGSTTAFDMNREFGIYFNHPARVSHLSRIMTEDFQHENSQSWQEGFECKKDYL
jgi:phosphatidylserine/phosphatidylglycerophosphate/cardiolipin synthase-like enzyme